MQHYTFIHPCLQLYDNGTARTSIDHRHQPFKSLEIRKTKAIPYIRKIRNRNKGNKEIVHPQIKSANIAARISKAFFI